MYLQEKGHPKVLQLDGGILRYFEEVGGAHWQGECFVFDERVSLDPGLKASGKTLADRKDGKKIVVSERGEFYVASHIPSDDCSGTAHSRKSASLLPPLKLPHKKPKPANKSLLSKFAKEIAALVATQEKASNKEILTNF